ncbi:MAG: hypothetical protein ACLVJ6_00090 [Merdibacter sp.]
MRSLPEGLITKKTFGDCLRCLANGFRGVDDEFLEEVMIIPLKRCRHPYRREDHGPSQNEAARQRLKTLMDQ